MRVLPSEFDRFWEKYPRKIGRLAAVKAYEKARQLATADDILAGVERYLEHLPDEPRFICHAQTFCNQGRWMDSYDTPKPKPKATLGIYKPYVPLKYRVG